MNDKRRWKLQYLVPLYFAVAVLPGCCVLKALQLVLMESIPLQALCMLLPLPFLALIFAIDARQNIDWKRGSARIILVAGGAVSVVICLLFLLVFADATQDILVPPPPYPLRGIGPETPEARQWVSAWAGSCFAGSAILTLGYLAIIARTASNSSQ